MGHNECTAAGNVWQCQGVGIEVLRARAWGKLHLPYVDMECRVVNARIVCPNVLLTRSTHPLNPPCPAPAPATGVAQMLTYYSSNEVDNGTDGVIAGSMQLSREDIRQCKSEAISSVRVPPHVIQLITDLRNFLQVRVGAGTLNVGLVGKD